MSIFSWKGAINGMSAKRRKDGRYEITTRIAGNKLHFYGATAYEAEEKMWRAIINYKDNDSDVPDNYQTFGEIRDEWYATKKNFVEAATRRMYEVDCFSRIASLDKKNISRIEVRDINSIMLLLREKTNIAEKVYMCLNQIFKYAVRKRAIVSNPMDLIARPKHRTNEKSRRALTENEKKVIEKVKWNKRQELLLKLFLDYGLRKQEATALQKRNIDLKNRTITIDHANDYTTSVPRTKKPKSVAGNRIVPMLDDDVCYFEKLINEMKEDDYLLQMANGRALTENSYRQLWDSVRRRMRKTAGAMGLEIPGDLTPRMCRHEYSIRIMNLSEREQMYLMGHEDISTTQKNYQTIGVEHINRKELNKISKKKNGSPSSGKK